MTTAMQERDHWDAQAGDESSAERAVWSEDPGNWAERVAECMDLIAPALWRRPVEAVAEIGCGIGRLTIPLAARYFDVAWYGFDVSADMVAHAHGRRVRAGVTNADFAVCDGRRLIPVRPMPWPAMFDAVYSMVAFQHMPAEVVAGYIADIATHLRPGGVLRFQYVAGEVAADFDHRFQPHDVHGWCEAAGFEVVEHDQGLIYPEWGWVTAVRL